MDQARQLAGGRFPAGVEAFYRELNGFELEWQLKDAAGSAGAGFVNILPIQRVFGDWKDTTWFDSVPASERFRPVQPFDLFQPEACACFCKAADAPAGDDVYFHFFGEDLSQALCTFPEYLERLLVSRGYSYWIRALLPGSKDDLEVAAFLSAMPLIFPDFKPDLFRPLR
jgi:hypothetical protein